MIRVVKVNGLRTSEQRATVCYVGRAFAGWSASPWGNPFKPTFNVLTIRDCLISFFGWAREAKRLLAETGYAIHDGEQRGPWKE